MFAARCVRRSTPGFHFRFSLHDLFPCAHGEGRGKAAVHCRAAQTHKQVFGLDPTLLSWVRLHIFWIQWRFQYLGFLMIVSTQKDVRFILCILHIIPSGSSGQQLES